MAYSTPDLPYAYDALEPYIDRATMEFHHDKHHVGYTRKLNKALEGTEYADMPIEQLLTELSQLPDGIQTAVRNNGGGHYNHGLYWKVMGPDGGGEPEGELSEAISRTYGSFDAFAEEFTAAATSRFGSGWAWLALSPEGELTVLSTPNQESPLTLGLTPILGIDVWEHAYYLKYQNRRPEYVKNFFNVINWSAVSELYGEAR